MLLLSSAAVLGRVTPGAPTTRIPQAAQRSGSPTGVEGVARTASFACTA